MEAIKEPFVPKTETVPANPPKKRGAAAKQPANEIEAMNQCYLALRPLRVDQRKRVMQAVMVMLGGPAADA